MNLEEYTQEKILDDVSRLQLLYGLKREIRYNQNRHATDTTESVAEHVYGMHILAQYFLPLEDPLGQWDHARIFEMITLHDIDEVETGDMLGYNKTEADRAGEIDAMKRVLAAAPLHMQKNIEARVEEYEANETVEAKFVRAVDKMEPIVHLSHKETAKVLLVIKATVEQSLSIKIPYVSDFPFIQKFCNIAHTYLENEGYFWIEEK
jgi:putative hydrolase of HD superfamily